MDPELEEEDELGVDEELRGRDEERGREVEPVGQLEQPLHTMLILPHRQYCHTAPGTLAV